MSRRLLKILASALFLLVLAPGLARATGLDPERVTVAPGIAWYSFTVPVGPGTHDAIRVHRIVRERAPWLPARASRGVLLAHGDGWGFAPTFLSSLAAPAVPDSQSLAVYLAQHGVDVWGLDFRWSRVPAGTADLSFLADWGLGTSLEDLEAALTAARLVRGATGSGHGSLHLLGFSRGGQVGWAALSAEAPLPRALRHVRGFIALEHTFKTGNEAIRQSNCARHAAILNQMANGALVTDFSFVAEIGDLALSAPDDPSPFFSIVSNADFAELVGADVTGGSIPYFHSTGGLIDPETLATELLYTRPQHWFAFLAGISPVQPLAIDRDGAALVCDQMDSPYDDHLGEIDVPILSIGAAGAYGANTFHTATLTASTDITERLVSAGTAPTEDYGHNDLFLADSAEALVWQPILEWIQAH